MAVFRSRISVASEDFRRNRGGMLALIGELRELEGRARLASERSAERFAHRGQLLPRERLARVLDPGAPFLELQNLTGYAMTDNGLDADRATSVPGGNQLVGIGFVSGARCVVVVTDSGINAGAFNAAGGRKSFGRKRSRRRIGCRSCTWWKAPARISLPIEWRVS
jgi:geranyl-CoA carboxylase beta subunit